MKIIDKFLQEDMLVVRPAIFIYVNKELKKIIKMKANMISNIVKNQGIEVSPFYIENELFQTLKAYGYMGKTY